MTTRKGELWNAVRDPEQQAEASLETRRRRGRLPHVGREDKSQMTQGRKARRLCYRAGLACPA